MDWKVLSSPAQDLALYKKFRNKEVASAARGLVGLFRELAPGLLEKRDRGRGADVTVAPAAYGAATIAARIPGAELLQAAEAREAAGEASEGEQGSSSDDDEGFGSEGEEGFASGNEELQGSGSEAEAAGDGEEEVSDADDASSDEEQEAGGEDLMEERGSGLDAGMAAASEGGGADERLSGGEGPGGGAEAPSDEAGSDSGEASASDGDSAGTSDEGHEADARAAGRERDVIVSRREARRERAASGAAAGPSAGARSGSGGAAGLKRARAPEAESLQSLKRRLKGAQARKAAADVISESGPEVGRHADDLAASGSHEAGRGRGADGDGTGADEAGVPGGGEPDPNPDGRDDAAAHVPLEHGRILSGEDFARMRELRHKAMVAAAMRKHGLKSASKRGRLLAAAEEEAEEALAAQVCTHLYGSFLKSGFQKQASRMVCN